MTLVIAGFIILMSLTQKEAAENPEAGGPAPVEYATKDDAARLDGRVSAVRDACTSVSTSTLADLARLEVRVKALEAQLDRMKNLTAGVK